MKKFINKIKKLNNQGSALMMVLVSLSFIAIIVAALLTAAGYAYKLKLQNKNSKDNFYVVEQAMNEVYAGVGSLSVNHLREAYEDTVKNMVVYNVEKGVYETKPSDVLQKTFKEEFLKRVQTDPFFGASDTANLTAQLQSYITSPEVKVVDDELYVYKEVVNGKLESVTIRNVTLERTVEYKNAGESGMYTQRISADIQVSEPDFTVLFNAGGTSDSNLFKFSMVADSGVEITQPSDKPITITGNVYAASDFYNKDYNFKADANAANTIANTKKYTGKTTSTETKETEVYTYYKSENLPVTAEKSNYYYQGTTAGGETSSSITNLDNYLDTWNGSNDQSKYSGIYIQGSNVSILGDMIIVPGTIATMNGANLSVYAKTGGSLTTAEIWADNIVLGNTKSYNTSVAGDIMLIKGNMFVKDDTSLDADRASFTLNGAYYGYSDATFPDDMHLVTEYTNRVNGGEYAVTNKDHYNSSAIVVNGQNTKLDLSQTQALFLNGRAYIEMSKNTTTVTTKNDTVETVTNSYTYDSATQDYRTGESISIKSNQLAYIPIKTSVIEVTNSAKEVVGYKVVIANEMYNGGKNDVGGEISFFEHYFPRNVYKTTVEGKERVEIPVIKAMNAGRSYYYYDFVTSFNILKAYDLANNTNYAVEWNSADDYTVSFINDYIACLKADYEEDTDPFALKYPVDISEYLTDITNYKDFTMDSLKLRPSGQTFASGALTAITPNSTNTSTTFDLTSSNSSVSKNINTFSPVGFDKFSATYTELSADTVTAVDYAKALNTEYAVVKWNLGHYDLTDSIQSTEKSSFITDYQSSTNTVQDSYITPINKYINIKNINSSDLGGVAAGEYQIGGSSNGYKVWVENGDITINDKGAVRGIIISQGDVTFGPNVKSFSGLIVAAGKVKISDTNSIQSLEANAEICRTIINACSLYEKGSNERNICALFKGYEYLAFEDNGELETSASVDGKDINMIDYTDVCQVNNWKKNVQ